MRLLACDPGAKPGYAWCTVTPSRGVTQIGLGTAPPDEGFDMAVFEAQHAATHVFSGGRKRRVSRKSQQTLSFTAGRQFEAVQAAEKYRIPVDDWRRTLWPGARRLPKTVVLARLRREYADIIPRGATADAVEALGILLAWCRLGPSERKKYHVK